MTTTFSKYYDQGLEYQKMGDYPAAAEAFKKATLHDKNHPEAWYQAGFVLMRLSRHAEAGMYLRRALAEYEQKIAQEYQKDYHLYRKACILALLGDWSPALSALAASVNYNPLYAEYAQQAAEFEKCPDPTTWQDILALPLEKLKSLRYRGQKLQRHELPTHTWLHRAYFLDFLALQGWQTEAYASLWENDLALTPQASALYLHNPALDIRLSYYLDEQLLFMELLHRQEPDNAQAYRIYLQNGPEATLAIIRDFQDQVNYHNWEDFMEALIEVCRSLLFEMPDGRKVKVA
ncbi:MAG: tetratricopeptide repeat protein [Microscillaceae bacterium]|nr:tetratricopeptide repeat protein [Microscillaceae bacterium]